MQIPIGSTYIDVYYTDGAAHIINNSALTTALYRYGALAVAEAVKNYYQREYNKELNVWTKSMAIEIIGHVVPDRVCRIILDSPDVPQFLKDQAEIIVEHMSIIDSGEESVDSNRWFWDDIALITTVASAILAIF